METNVNELEIFLLECLNLYILENEITIEIVDRNTRLIGSNSIFDSLQLVNFIVFLEEKIEEKYNLSITIADEKAMSMSTSPFNNILYLTKFILSKI